MPTPIKMPQFGESVPEGTIAQWLKQPGDSVEKFEPLLAVSTDKIDTEIPAPINGFLLEILVAEGETVEAGTIIGYIGALGESIPIAKSISTVASGGGVRMSIDAGSEEIASPQTVHDESKPAGRNFVSPVVARMAAEHQINLAQISGSGLGGRVTKKDLLAYLANDASSPTSVSGLSGAEMPAEPVKSPAFAQTLVTQPAAQAISDDETLHPLTTMRRAIAQHMVQSKATSPHVTTIFEVDMTEVVRHREAHKADFAKRGVKLNYMAYFVAAAGVALQAELIVNSRFTEKGIVTSQRIHIGVAVALPDSPEQLTDGGLMVPVIRDVDEKNLQGIARAIQDFSISARSQQLTPEDMRGGTFTITNHGVSGSLIGTPIINQPQAGILGVGAIVKRPIVRSAVESLLPHADDAIVIRPMCYLNFTFDHRILDGAVADRFVARIKRLLESWGKP